MALDEDQVASVISRWRSPEMREASFVKRRRGLIARQMAAKLGAVFVCLEHQRQRIPTDNIADALLDLAITGMRSFKLWCDGVEIGRIRGERKFRAFAARGLHSLAEKLIGAARPFECDDGCDRFLPFERFSIDRGSALRFGLVLRHERSVLIHDIKASPNANARISRSYRCPD